jgi:TusA-related sulfurtransferase
MTLSQDVALEIDITSEVCPMTFVRTRLALDRLGPGDLLLIHLKGREPLENVPRSATALGHEVVSLQSDAHGVSHLLIRRASGPA